MPPPPAAPSRRPPPAWSPRREPLPRAKFNKTQPPRGAARFLQNRRGTPADGVTTAASNPQVAPFRARVLRFTGQLAAILRYSVLSGL